MINESIIQWGYCDVSLEIVFPSSNLRSILFSIETENSQKKEKKNLLITLRVISATVVIGIPMMGLGGPLTTFLGFVTTVGGIYSGLYYAILLHGKLKK